MQIWYVYYFSLLQFSGPRFVRTVPQDYHGMAAAHSAELTFLQFSPYATARFFWMFSVLIRGAMSYELVGYLKNKSDSRVSHVKKPFVNCALETNLFRYIVILKKIDA